jgi:membrane protein implicated in regulation of membrane protease activity
MIFNWIIDHIPLWAWVTLICLFSAAMFYYTSPIIIPLWNLLPKWIKVTLGALLAVVLALLGGRYKGRKDAEEEQRKRDAEAIARRKEVDNEVDKLPEKTVHDQLSRWNRTDDS